MVALIGLSDGVRALASSKNSEFSDLRGKGVKRARHGRVERPTRRVGNRIGGGFQLQVLQTRPKDKKAFPTARPVHTVQCMCVPPWPVPWATWHTAELTHATRVASHRVRAQSTQSSPPAADGDWSTQRLCFPAGCLKPMALPTPLQAIRALSTLC